MSQSLLSVFRVTESYKLPDKIMEALLSDRAEKIVSQLKSSFSGNIRDTFQEDHGDRKGLKQDFTPDCICRLVARLMIPEGDMLDMCSGTGALSSAASQMHHFEVHEQEYSERAIPFALLEASLSGLQGYISHADCLGDSVFETYLLKSKGEISIPRKVEARKAGKFRNVIMNPPYSMKLSEAGPREILGLQIPKSRTDYGFLLRGLEHLQDDGRLLAILPHGVLFRGGAEEKIREYLIKRHMISAVIGLPDKLFLNTGIPVCVLVLEKGAQDILFIDAKEEYVKGSAQNDMTEQQIDKIVKVFENRKEAERFSHIASEDEVYGNDFNLNIPRYVDTFVKEPLPDMKSLLNDLNLLEQEEQRVRRELYNTLGQLNGEGLNAEIIQEHRRLMKPKKAGNNCYGQIAMEEFL